MCEIALRGSPGSARDPRKSPSQKPDAALAASGFCEGALRGSLADPGEPRKATSNAPAAPSQGTLAAFWAPKGYGRAARLNPSPPRKECDIFDFLRRGQAAAIQKGPICIEKGPICIKTSSETSGGPAPTHLALNPTVRYKKGPICIKKGPICIKKKARFRKCRFMYDDGLHKKARFV